MAVFRLTLNREDWYRYRVRGSHRWILPPLSCSACGATWSSTGEAYPTVEVGDLATRYPTSAIHPLDNEEFGEVRRQLRPLVPENAALRPGAEFGAFSGTARGKFYDFVWNERWTMFLTDDAREALETKGVQLPPGRAPDLKAMPRTALPSMTEPEAVPLLDLAHEGLENPDAVPCSECGRVPSGFRAFLMREDTTLPEGVDLCRARNNAAVYVVSQRFVEAAAALELTGYVAQPLTMKVGLP